MAYREATTGMREEGQSPGRRVLVVAYYFPPMGLSGVQRVAKFVRHLPAFGWQPTVLTVEPGGYFAYDEALRQEVAAAGVEVVRTGSLDPTRLFGREQTVPLPGEASRRRLADLSQWLFLPDNKIGWYPAAVRAGRRLLRSRPFDLVFSTAPPYTAHLVGRALARVGHLPLVTDFRDDWLGNPRHTYPTALHRRLQARMERSVLAESARIITINPHIAGGLRARTPGEDRVLVIPQGYDPDDFRVAPAPRSRDVLRFVYAGVFYDAQRPDVFLRGLAEFLGRRPEARGAVEAVFVGLFPEEGRRLVSTLGLDSSVVLTGYLSHPDAVAYLTSADVLWMTIGARPGAEGISTGKLYEYLGAGKAILGLVPDGVAREVLTASGGATVVPPDDVPAVSRAIEALYDAWRGQGLKAPDPAFVAPFDRRSLTGVLARTFDDCVRQ